MRWLCSTLLILFASACGGGLERVTFVTDRLEYASSDRVMLKLVHSKLRAALKSRTSMPATL